MIIFSSASKDTYITNKLIDSKFAVSGNVGRAGTLDLFKLYDESTVVTGAIELSRLLVKFDLAKASLLSSSSIMINNDSFNAKIHLKNISSGMPVPNNFTVEVFPLATEFNEGIGRDVISFSNVDSANFLSSSKGILWNAEGCGLGGNLGSSNIDYFVSGNLQNGEGLIFLGAQQEFPLGFEDLSIDVTKIVSATIAGIIPDYGFRISFNSSQENDEITRFVKRFASRHVVDQSLKPYLEFSCDDSTADYHNSSLFDTNNSLILRNVVRGQLTNFVSGSSLTEITGQDCMLVKISTGSFSHYVTASQVQNSSLVSGLYSASFMISSADQTSITGSFLIEDAIAASGSIKFLETWSSLDETVTFYSGSLLVKKQTGSIGSGITRKIRTSILSMKPIVRSGEDFTIKVNFFDDYEQDKSSKFPFDPDPLTIASCKIRIRNNSNGKLLFDFDNAGSKMSIDKENCNFHIYTDVFPQGVFQPEFQITVDGTTIVLDDCRSFKVIS